MQLVPTINEQIVVSRIWGGGRGEWMNLGKLANG
jgi:hypothetical protein